jgi:hypothetical protein
MTKHQFEEFLEQRARETREAEPIDWESRRRDWLQNLAGFYSTIEGYLRPYLESGKLRLGRSSVTLTEEHIGTYDADSMTILIGADKVKLVPIGTLIIAARGRVDMTGPSGTVKFILTGKHSNGVGIHFSVVGETGPAEQAPAPEPAAPEELVWKIATSPPRIQFIELTSETFFSALMEVVNG